MAYYRALDFWDVVVLEIIVVNGYALWRSGATGSQEWRVLLLWVYKRVWRYEINGFDWSIIMRTR